VKFHFTLNTLIICVIYTVGKTGCYTIKVQSCRIWDNHSCRWSKHHGTWVPILHVSTPDIPSPDSLKALKYSSLYQHRHICISWQHINKKMFNIQQNKNFIIIPEIKSHSSKVLRLITTSIVKLILQVSKDNCSLCIIVVDLKVTKVHEVCHIEKGGTLANKECDTHQI